MGPPMRNREGNGLPLMFKKVWWNRKRGGEIEKKRELVVSERGRKEVSLSVDRDADQESLTRKKRLADRTETSGGESDVKKGAIILTRHRDN
ncbi:hypothetical protein TNCV_4594371 [Trichonephila clavipes]|uniref:Uncharacterized protein n=1 Tax=Trichonephila clavipes TaxID=2585209 RepID=A0A8X6WF79_TRICX|nr:hypothetical protein TNCV_4594371 [Trichonephila clavipes]